jgi:hypothetical protein
VLGFCALLAMPRALAHDRHPATFDALVLLALGLTYLGLSTASVTYQASGPRSSPTRARARLFAWREALGLLGVLLAAMVTETGGARSIRTVWNARSCQPSRAAFCASISMRRSATRP